MSATLIERITENVPEFRDWLLQLPGSEDGAISCVSLLLLGVFWCQGCDFDKAEVIIECLDQKKRDSIDKLESNWAAVVETLLFIATIFMLKNYCKHTDFELPEEFDEETTLRAITAMRISTLEDDTGLFDRTGLEALVFGPNQTLSKKRLLQKLMSNDCNWLFNDSEIRYRLQSNFLSEDILREVGV